MSRNRTLLLSLVILLAITSFGFTARSSVGVIGTEGTVFKCPPGFQSGSGNFFLLGNPF